MNAWYDTALVCANGHLLNDEARTVPAMNSVFCPHCGEGAMDSCQECGSAIRGRYHQTGIDSPSLQKPPTYCPECGEPYPWTEERLRAARELTDELEGLSPAEREELKRSLEDLLHDGPRTELAAVRVKNLLRKVAAEGGRALYDVTLDLASEGAKRVLFAS